MGKKPRPIQDPDVASTFESFPPPIRHQLLALREAIYATAESTGGVGELQETLKWGEPAYLTPETGSGSTVRLGWKAAEPDTVALHFNCNTTLVEQFRTWYPNQLRFAGNRSILLRSGEPVPTEAIAKCIEAALTYHK